MKKNRLLSALLAGALCVSLAACGGTNAADSAGASSSQDAEPVELTVFAAASMTETLSEIADLYKVEAPNVSIVYNFDSSGTLKTRFRRAQCATCSCPRGRSRMDQLDAAADASVKHRRIGFYTQ